MAFERKFRNVVLLAKIETAKGTDAVPTGAANAILPVGEVTFTPVDAERVPRNVMRGYFGAPDALLGSVWAQVRFAVELQGSGVAGTAPAWGALLQACSYAETVTAGSRVEYTPVSTSPKSVSLYFYADGVLYKMLGAVGTFTGATLVDAIPALNFTFLAPAVAPTAVANATPTLTAWKVPALVNEVNTAQLVLGGAYATGAITGGTSYVTGGLEFDVGNQLSRMKLIGAKDSTITDRNVTGTIKTMDLTAAQEVALYTLITGGQAQSIGITHGQVAGAKILLFFPSGRLLGLTPVNLEGVWTSDVPFEAPPLAGNDDLRIVAL